MRKLNIHFTVDDDTERYVRLINKGLNNVAPSAAAYTADAPLTPHITLAMGTLREEIDDNIVIARVHEMTMNFLIQKVKIMPPLLEKGRGYVMGAIEGGTIAKIKNDFTDIMSDLIILNHTHSKAPHITFGQVTNEKEFGAVESFLKLCQNEFNCSCYFIEVSEATAKGACLESLFKIQLKEPLPPTKGTRFS